MAGPTARLIFPGANSTVAEGIDTAGDIVGWFLDSNNAPHGFLLSGGAYTQLDVPGVGETVAYGINDVAGGRWDGRLFRALGV